MRAPVLFVKDQKAMENVNVMDVIVMAHESYFRDNFMA